MKQLRRYLKRAHKADTGPSPEPGAPKSASIRLDRGLYSFSIDGMAGSFAFPKGWYPLQQKEIAQQGAYEPETSRFLAEQFPDGGEFVNLGSSMGWHLINLCKTKRVSHAHMFDMNPFTMPVMAYNFAQLENLGDYSLYPFGLTTGSSELLSFVVPAAGMGFSSIENPVDMTKKSAVSTYSGLINPSDIDLFDRVNWANALLLLDVEGAELGALRAIWSAIESARPKIVMELNEQISREDATALYELFSGLKYRFFSIQPDGGVEIEGLDDWYAHRLGKHYVNVNKRCRDVFLSPD